MRTTVDVKSVMASPVVTVLFNESMKVAVMKMVEHQVSSVVVISGGMPVGIITERDVLKVVAEGKDVSRVLASEAMSKPLMTIGPDAPVTDAIALMKNKGVRRIPVVRDSKLVGIITEKEIIRNLL